MRLVNWRFPKDHTYFINRQNAWIEKDTFQFYNSVAIDILAEEVSVGIPLVGMLRSNFYFFNPLILHMNR
jgi:hypothetical protein